MTKQKQEEIVAENLVLKEALKKLEIEVRDLREEVIRLKAKVKE